MLAIEHLWAIPLRDAVRDAGGLVLGHRSLTPEELVALGVVIGAEAELMAELDAVADEEAGNDE